MIALEVRDMCEVRPRRPRWPWLYATLLAMTGLLGVVETVVPSGLGRRILELLVALLGFALMALWVRANRIALEMSREPSAWTRALPPLTGLPAAEPDRAPVPRHIELEQWRAHRSHRRRELGRRGPARQH